MKIGKLALATVLAAGTVAAYVWFPNPLDLAAREPAGAPAAGSPDAAPPDARQPGGGKSM
jgi:hypothetical protein